MTTEDFLSPEERAEWSDLLDDALNGSRTVDSSAVDRAERFLLDAEQAQRPWARLVIRDFVRAGIRSRLNRVAKAESRILMATSTGTPVGTTTRIGVRRRTATGVEHTMPLLAEVTWSELDAWLLLIEGQLAAALMNRSKARRLLKLRDDFPDTKGPGEACALAGTTVERLLSEEAS